MKIYKYKDNVDTDVIIPARYLNSFDAKELASHAMVDIDPTFASTVEKGDIIVAGQNFGCGSSREHAPLCLKTAGVKCVIAKSFARIFYRNSINIGFPIWFINLVYQNYSQIKQKMKLTKVNHFQNSYKK